MRNRIVRQNDAGQLEAADSIMEFAPDDELAFEGETPFGIIKSVDYSTGKMQIRSYRPLGMGYSLSPGLALVPMPHGDPLNRE